jgi:cytochrome c biogenesis protein CcmG/thiol:disulfide interchange protein DsbE
VSRYLWPLGIFLLLVLFLGIGLTLDPRQVPSPLVGKAAPPFELPRLHEPAKTFSPSEMKGRVWMLNVWASWCVSCRDEHPVLVELAKMKLVPLYGLDYKDPREDALRWLKEFGDPYDMSVADVDGRIGIDYGVYGVPETYVIDKAGVIRYKHIGPVNREALHKTILPLIAELNR